jgi:hypothetical protein
MVEIALARWLERSATPPLAIGRSCLPWPQIPPSPSSSEDAPTAPPGRSLNQEK